MRKDEEARFKTAIAGLVDRLIQGRIDAEMKAIEHPDQLPRTELAKLRTEAERKARRCGLINFRVQEYASRVFAARLNAETIKQNEPCLK